MSTATNNAIPIWREVQNALPSIRFYKDVYAQEFEIAHTDYNIKASSGDIVFGLNPGQETWLDSLLPFTIIIECYDLVNKNVAVIVSKTLYIDDIIISKYGLGEWNICLERFDSYSAIAGIMSITSSSNNCVKATFKSNIINITVYLKVTNDMVKGDYMFAFHIIQ